MRLLIVDDTRINRVLMNKLLENFGERDLAENGLEAVKAVLQAWNEQKPYDLVFMDIMMPVLDGYGAIAKIREIENKQNIPEDEQIKIIMTTGKGDKQSIINSAKSGNISAYLVKPIIKETLHKELANLGVKPLK